MKEVEKKRREENGKEKGQFGSFLMDYAAATYTVQPGLYSNMWHFTIRTRKPRFKISFFHFAINCL